MTLLSTFWSYISSGQAFGLPTIVFMAIPFIIGLILGFLVKKMLKMVIPLVILVALAAYLGLVTINLNKLKDIFNAYGSQTAMYVAMIISIVPLSAGLIIGVIVAFMVG